MKTTDAPCCNVVDDTANVLSWGYSRGTFTNGHAGVQIRLRKDLFRPKHIVAVHSPPASLQGRGGA
eukprot:8549945-Pyramimonas_sp.AAC.1